MKKVFFRKPAIPILDVRIETGCSELNTLYAIIRECFTELLHWHSNTPSNADFKWVVLSITSKKGQFYQGVWPRDLRDFMLTPIWDINFSRNMLSAIFSEVDPTTGGVCESVAHDPDNAVKERYKRYKAGYNPTRFFDPVLSSSGGVVNKNFNMKNWLDTVEILWLSYLYTGDEQFLKNYLPSARRQLEGSLKWGKVQEYLLFFDPGNYLGNYRPEGLVLKNYYCLGTSIDLERTLRMMVAMEQITGGDIDQIGIYNQLANAIAVRIEEVFWSNERNRYIMAIKPLDRVIAPEIDTSIPWACYWSEDKSRIQATAQEIARLAVKGYWHCPVHSPLAGSYESFPVVGLHCNIDSPWFAPLVAYALHDREEGLHIIQKIVELYKRDKGLYEFYTQEGGKGAFHYQTTLSLWGLLLRGLFEPSVEGIRLMEPEKIHTYMLPAAIRNWPCFGKKINIYCKKGELSEVKVKNKKYNSLLIPVSAQDVNYEIGKKFIEPYLVSADLSVICYDVSYSNKKLTLKLKQQPYPHRIVIDCGQEGKPVKVFGAKIQGYFAASNKISLDTLPGINEVSIQY